MMYYVNLFLGETNIENNIPQLFENSGIYTTKKQRFWDAGIQKQFNYQSNWDALKMAGSMK